MKKLKKYLYLFAAITLLAAGILVAPYARQSFNSSQHDVAAQDASSTTYALNVWQKDKVGFPPAAQGEGIVTLAMFGSKTPTVLSTDQSGQVQLDVANVDGGPGILTAYVPGCNTAIKEVFVQNGQLWHSQAQTMDGQTEYVPTWQFATQEDLIPWCGEPLNGHDLDRPLEDFHTLDGGCPDTACAMAVVMGLDPYAVAGTVRCEPKNHPGEDQYVIKAGRYQSYLYTAVIAYDEFGHDAQLPGFACSYQQQLPGGEVTKLRVFVIEDCGNLVIKTPPPPVNPCPDRTDIKRCPGTATPTPAPPTATSTPKPGETQTPVETPTKTKTPKPGETLTPVPTSTATSVPTATKTPKPGDTPTRTPISTSTPPVKTSTPKPPTVTPTPGCGQCHTPETPVNTPTQPVKTSTPVFPTSTPKPPTPTKVPPTATKVPPTAVPPTATIGCGECHKPETPVNTPTQPVKTSTPVF